eukprot:TRINITY_DN3929_c0_g1_i1.p1 TRINITY_DN3929_c0_g1~~TRINITY_DN3929_c0_g1_i1.p1  ORF type:complete len:324 (-),score=33.78 TRINITY_DN3929_c0_g1_i1:64-1035(-)
MMSLTLREMDRVLPKGHQHYQHNPLITTKFSDRMRLSMSSLNTGYWMTSPALSTQYFNHNQVLRPDEVINELSQYGLLDDVTNSQGSGSSQGGLSEQSQSGTQSSYTSNQALQPQEVVEELSKYGLLEDIIRPGGIAQGSQVGSFSQSIPSSSSSQASSSYQVNQSQSRPSQTISSSYTSAQSTESIGEEKALYRNPPLQETEEGVTQFKSPFADGDFPPGINIGPSFFYITKTATEDGSKSPSTILKQQNNKVSRPQSLSKALGGSSLLSSYMSKQREMSAMGAQKDSSKVGFHTHPGGVVHSNAFPCIYFDDVFLNNLLVF